jgi:hypothetical protein
LKWKAPALRGFLFSSTAKALREMIDDDDDDARQYLIELARRDERLRQIDDLKRTGEPISGSLYRPRNDTGRTAYCGPTAMAAVTGEPVSVIENAIRGFVSAEPPNIIGVNDVQLLAAMELLGWHVVEEGSINDGLRCKLDEFAKAHGRDGPYIVAVTEHYVAISENEFCDTGAKQPCDLFDALDQSRWWCKRIGSTWVRHWWRFAEVTRNVNFSG